MILRQNPLLAAFFGEATIQGSSLSLVRFIFYMILVIECYFLWISSLEFSHGVRVRFMVAGNL
jgi:hypothetical protein